MYQLKTEAPSTRKNLKGYRVYIPSKNKIITTTDIFFDEKNFQLETPVRYQTETVDNNSETTDVTRETVHREYEPRTSNRNRKEKYYDTAEWSVDPLRGKVATITPNACVLMILRRTSISRSPPLLGTRPARFSGSRLELESHTCY